MLILLASAEWFLGLKLPTVPTCGRCTTHKGWVPAILDELLPQHGRFGKGVEVPRAEATGPRSDVEAAWTQGLRGEATTDANRKRLEESDYL